MIKYKKLKVKIRLNKIMKLILIWMIKEILNKNGKVEVD